MDVFSSKKNEINYVIKFIKAIDFNDLKQIAEDQLRGWYSKSVLEEEKGEYLLGADLKYILFQDDIMQIRLLKQDSFDEMTNVLEKVKNIFNHLGIQTVRSAQCTVQAHFLAENVDQLFFEKFFRVTPDELVNIGMMQPTEPGVSFQFGTQEGNLEVIIQKSVKLSEAIYIKLELTHMTNLETAKMPELLDRLQNSLERAIEFMNS